MGTKYLLASLFCFIFFSWASPAFSNSNLALSVSIDKEGTTAPGQAANTPNADTFVSDQVRKALSDDENNNVTVDTKKGIVTLTGTVSDDATKAALGKKVVNVPGVKGVDNKLEVEK